MPKMRSDVIREMSKEEIDEELLNLRAALIRERAMISAGGTMERKVNIRNIRKNIARLLTIKREKGVEKH